MSGGSAPAGGARPAVARRGRRRSTVVTQVVVLAVLAFVVAALVVYVGSLGLTFDTMRKTAPDSQIFPAAGGRPTPAATGSTAAAQNILLIGTDGEGTAPTLAGVKQESADTLLLVHVPSDGKHAYVISMQRNTWVSIPGHGAGTVDTALAVGGVPTVVSIVEKLTGARVDHVAIVSIGGFAKVTDALGGVTLDNPVAFTRGGYSFASGRITVDGAQAQQLARTGGSSGLTGAQQVRAQQAYLAGVLKKLLSAGTLLNPITLHNTVAAISPYLLVDQSLDAVYIANLTLELRSLRSSNISFLSMPVERIGMQAGQSVVYLDPTKLAALAADLQHDTVGEYQP